ncbi:MAG: hypothetical protein ACKO43_08005 [Alphaproteobacteria bacterium]
MRHGFDMPVGDAVVAGAVKVLVGYTNAQQGDTPAQVQIKVGLKTAVAFLEQCQGNVSEAMTSLFQDVRAFFRAMLPSDNDDLTHNYGIVVGFFAGLFFCTRQGVAWGRSLLEQCLHEALEMTKKVLQWLQNEELQSQALTQDGRTRFQGA